MLSIPNKLLKYLRAASTKLVAIVSFVTSILSDEQSTLADWQDGSLGGVAGVDYPATVLTAGVATADVAITVNSTDGFTIGADDPNVGYLVLYDGTNREICSYAYSTGNQFQGLVRGLYGTSPRVFGIGDFVLQLQPGLGLAPYYNLAVSEKNWTQQAAAGGPPVARTGSRMVYAPTTGLYYMFGGYDPIGAIYLNDLWSFDPATNTWALLAPAGGPPVIRGDHVFVYHPVFDYIYLIGGVNAGGGLVDTWYYDIVGNSWNASVAIPAGVGGLFGAQACFAQETVLGPGGIFVIGGVKRILFDQYQSAVYFFNGLAWNTTKFPSIPIGLAYGTATYIEATGQILLMGIQQYNGYLITYLWDPVANAYWNTLTVTPFPENRISHSAVYDNVNGTVLLFGGEVVGGVSAFDDLYIYYPSRAVGGTWEWSCPYLRENRSRHVAAFDTINHEMLVWGGWVDNTPTLPGYIHPMRFKYYWQSAKYITGVIDLGEIPEDDGIWLLEDITDTTYRRTYIDYTGEWSDTGIAPWTSIGAIYDGDTITDLHRYWRVQVHLQNDGLDTTPQVTLIDVNHNTYLHLSMASRPIDDYPPLVKSISTLSSKVDVQSGKGSIGEMRIELIRSGQVADQVLKTSFPKRKPVEVKLGVLEDDISISDFHLVLRARADDWDVSATQIVFKLADYLDEVKQDIPQEDISGIVIPLDYSVGGIATNPVDIILDILQNQINLPDRDIDLDSFFVVRNNPAIVNWQFRQDICCPEDASKLLADLCKHIGAALLPRENGKLSLILFDADDAIAMTWNELDQAFTNEKFMGKASSIRNYISTWWGWDGDGDEVADWTGIEVATDATSIARHNSKILRTKSKWLGRALPPPNPPYAGDVIALAISDRILDLSKVGLQEISLSTNMSAFEAQVGDLVRIQSSVVRNNSEYKRWQSDNERERDKLTFDILNDCSVIADWTFNLNATVPTLDVGVFTQGAASINIGKSGVVNNTVFYNHVIPVPPSPFNGMNKKGVFDLFIHDITELKSTNDALRVYFWTSTGYYWKRYTQAELVNGWQTIGGDLPDGFTAAGAPGPVVTDINRVRITFYTNVAADLIPHGHLKMDNWRLLGRQVPATTTGRYSLPYINYGTNECVDLKWWIKSKSVDFSKGKINWGLVRARQVPLHMEYTTQADWYSGNGENIDLETTPGSVLIAIETAPNYYQSAFGELLIDLGQQPEQDGVFTIEDTVPLGTGIVYEVWSSETGEWAGEENYMDFVVDGDAVSIKARFYKVRARLFSDVALLVTPSIERFLLRFDLG